MAEQRRSLLGTWIRQGAQESINESRIDTEAKDTVLEQRVTRLNRVAPTAIDIRPLLRSPGRAK
ncbi:hypothetical protein ACQX4I_08920 [Corynebacterium diphtheriae]|uniref:hypothetical protein n=1 Tax=Corynebacterium diphtheriae TaxID=1717 RepID=UPI0018CA367A|nr:hypothetical protein [Corynebacterium diphtheriae]